MKCAVRAFFQGGIFKCKGGTKIFIFQNTKYRSILYHAAYALLYSNGGKKCAAGPSCTKNGIFPFETIVGSTRHDNKEHVNDMLQNPTRLTKIAKEKFNMKLGNTFPI